LKHLFAAAPLRLSSPDYLAPIIMLAAFLFRIAGLVATLDSVIDRICANIPYVLCSFLVRLAYSSPCPDNSIELGRLGADPEN
jgi:hypothetical protein